ncbi:MAG: peptidoglycan DD-metalloendopeptidase family protein [Alphaproteobacteria bacterium]|nr:peptidoglycan DD-metalloendopeptidase family protein [Alphaproteobacteria bacterium]
MSTSSVAGILAFFQRLFPHRQFYLRSRGSVQFFELSPTFQMTVAAASLLALGWIAYSSVVVIFKEQIITAKNQRYASMQAAYEGRISQMQLQYDELNGLLVLAEERFQNATRDLEAKHRQLTALLMQKQAMDKSMRDVKRQVAVMEGYAGRTPTIRQASAGGGDSNVLMMQVADADSATRQSRDTQQFSDSAIASVAASLSPHAGGHGKSTLAQNYVVRRIAALEDRLKGIEKSQMSLLSELGENATGQIDHMEAVIRMTGLSVDQVVATVGDHTGRGGPLIPVADIRSTDGLTDDFEKQFTVLAKRFDRLDSLTTALSRIPLVTPIASGLYRLTSGFGYRVDPFTGRVAFHSGTDLAGEFGTPVLATAPGRVIAAERRGPYGLMVELDHGHGIHTRYGHLQAALVKPGDFVQFRQRIALMGSSGRSTGPHCHYEVWFNSVVRDPIKFFEAGRYVYKG